MKSLGRVQNFKFSKKKNAQNLGFSFFYILIFKGPDQIKETKILRQTSTMKCTGRLLNQISLNSLPSNHIFLFQYVYLSTATTMKILLNSKLFIIISQI